MNKILKIKIKEAFTSVLPITLIVLAASVILTPLPSGTILMFITGAALLVVGMGFFTLGADMAMMPMGEGIGTKLTKSSKVFLIIPVTLIIGFIISVAEPDLQVLGEQTPGINNWLLVSTVSIGVAIFLVIAVLRPLFKIRLSVLLLVFYAVVFIIALYVPKSFIPVAFDSGGVTTGPITVPFILAMGIGVASVRSDKDSQNDSFGLVALCSIGPIIAVLILGIFFKSSNTNLEDPEIFASGTSREVINSFLFKLPKYLKDICIPLGAIIFCFFLFQIITHRYHRHQLARIAIGFIYTFIGLVLFLTGVNVGFSPAGQLLGLQLASSQFKWILIPLSILIGYFIVSAEPAVHVLNKHVEEISSGAITSKMMYRGLAVGMAAALAITMCKILLHIPIMWILVPGYIISLALTFFVPKIFTGIAFDSGGVCSGPMSSTFLLPFAKGVCEGVKGNILVDAFGIIAMVAMTPLIVIQFMGLVYKLRTREAAAMIEQTDVAMATKAGLAIDWTKITEY